LTTHSHHYTQWNRKGKIQIASKEYVCYLCKYYEGCETHQKIGEYKLEELIKKGDSYVRMNRSWGAGGGGYPIHLSCADNHGVRYE